MLVWTGEFLCWLVLLRPLVRCCWLYWPLNLVTHSGGRNLTYIMLVAIRNIRAELYGHCTVKETCKDVLNIALFITNGS